ncbi:MAG: ABC transporter permease [Chloroherpetonaceae bacterium]|nr:ABC transporter permease [Chloroherpetonaceae bacterium]MDW8437070.1 ABC transporter permease [Chloroherpetonaceae bacterium]
MDYAEIVKMAFDSLRAHKLRSGLTMLGITVGVFSIIGVMTILGALQNTIETGLSELGANTFQIQKYPATLVGGVNWNKYNNRRDIDYDDALAFKRIMGDDAKIGIEIAIGAKQAVYQGRKTNPNLSLIGGDPNCIANNGYDLAYGRNLSDEDLLYARNVIVIGDGVQKMLFETENPIGKEIKFDGRNYVVVGVLELKGSAFGQGQDNFALIPITRFLTNYGRMGRSLNITIQAPSQALYQSTMDKAIGAMRLARKLKAEDLNDFEIYANDSLVKQFQEFAGVIRIGAFIISFIALVAAGVGIMNIMLVSVTERTKEIGIRKSVGAKKSDILAQFLLEALVLSLSGGALGVAGGALGGNAVAAAMNAPFVFPFDWAAIGLLTCSAIGAIFGFYPAYKAASLDPIEALRFE